MDASGPRTVGLPMYDPPELHATVDAWWNGLARAFRAEGVAAVPDGLDRAYRSDVLRSSSDRCDIVRVVRRSREPVVAKEALRYRSLMAEREKLVELHH